MDGKLLINEVAALLSIEPSAIRYWERKGLLHLKRDDVNGYRYFDSKALLEVLDIVFFRKLQLPIKVLGDHLMGTVEDRRIILDNAKEEVTSLIQTLKQTEAAISFRLERLHEIEKLQKNMPGMMQKQMTFSTIESLNLLHEKHTQQYLNDPSHFVLLFEGDGYERVQEGIIVDEKEPIDKYIIWQKQTEIEIIFGGLLIVHAENHQRNTLGEIRKERSIDPIFNQVIAQYLSSGKEGDALVDYYKCWFLKGE